MANNVGTAKITIEADYASFQKDVEAFFGKTGKSAGDALDKGVKSGADAASKSAEAVGKSATQSAKTAEQAFDGVAGAAGKAGSESASKFGTGVSGVGKAAQGSANAAKESFNGVAAAAGQAGSGATRQFSVGIGGISGAATRVAQAASTAWGTVSSGAGRAASAAGRAFSAGLSGVSSTASRVAQAASTSLSSIGSAATRVAGSIRSSLSSAMEEAKSKSSGLAGNLTKLGGGMLAVAGPVAALKGGFDRLMNIQRAEIIFKNIGLSADQTKAQMARLTEQVTGTSVSLADAAKYSGMFAQAGVEMGKPMDNAIQSFTSLASIAEGSGVDVGRVLAQISANGKVTGEDLMQMSDAGINATKYLADSMNMSQADVKKVVSDGKVSFEDFVTAVNAGTGDLAKEMGQTLPAKLANFRTALSSLGAAAIEPFIPIMTTMVEFGISILKNAVAPLKTFTAFLGESSAAATVVKGVLMAVATAVGGAFVLMGVNAAVAGAKIVGAWVLSGAASVVEGAKQIGILAATVGGWIKAGATALIQAGRMATAWVIAGGKGSAHIVSSLATMALEWSRAATASLIQAGRAATAWVIAAPKRMYLWTVAFGQMVAGWVRAAAVATVQAGKMAIAWVIAAPKNPLVWAQMFATMVGGWIRAAAAATLNAGKIAAAWLIAAPKAGFAGISTLAAFAGAWVRTAATATLNALKIAAAWLISLGPIGLVIGAIAGIIAIFVTLWNRVEGFRNFFIGIWDAITAAVSAAWTWIRDTIIGIWDGLVSWFQSGGVSAVWDTIVSGAQTAWDTLVNIWNGVAGFFGAIFSGVATAISAAWDVIYGVFMWAWETVLSPIYTWISETWGKIAEVLGPAWDTLTEKITAFGTWFMEFWSGTIWPLLEQVIGFFQRIGQAIGSFISEHWEVFKTALIVLGTVLLTPIIIGLGLVVAAIVAVVAAVGLVVGAITGFIYLLVKLPGWIAGVVSAVVDWFQSMWHKIQDAFSAAGGAISGFWNNYVAPLPGQIGSAIGSVISWFGRLPGMIRDKLSDAGSWLINVGKDIIRGLINGIKDMAGAAVDAVKDVGGKIKDGVTGFFKIGSPSKMFHEFGGWLVEGMANGIRDKEALAVKATESMAAKVAAVDMQAPRVGDVELPTAVAATAVATVPASPAPSSTSTGGAASTGAATDPTVAPQAFTDAASQMQATAASVLTPLWSQQMLDMQNWGLTAQTQAMTMVNPALQGVGLTAQTMNMTAWQPVMLGMQQGMVNTALTTQLQAGGVLNPALNSVGATAWGVLNGSVNPAMAGMRGAVQNTANSFGMAASNIATQWNRVREATAAPARFAIQSVFNDGIVGMWNSVSELLGTKKMGTYPVRFASGGYVRGPGGPRADKIPALLSDKEFVVNAKATKALGPENLAALNSGHYGVAPGVLRDPRERRAMLRDKTFTNIAARYQGGGLATGTPAWKSLLRGYNWARSRNGRPYVWGGSANGSGGADCSGFMSGIADVILGGSGARQWATMNFPGTQQGAWKPGLAAGFAVGISDVHTAGTIGGAPGIPPVNVESGGVNSRMKFGTPDAAGANDGQFNRRFALIVTDAGSFMPGRGSGASMGDIVGGLMAPFRDKMTKGADAWARSHPGIVNTMPQGVAKKLGGAAEKKIQKLAEEMMSDPGGSGAERWRPMAKRAMARVGFDYNNPAQVNAMIAQIASESGGIPNRAQEIVDVNGTGASAGLGLLQIIPSTFAAFRDPALPNDRTNPFANMVAALRYYKSRYGMDLTTMWGHGHGYDFGGEMVGKGLFAKKTTEAERVLSPHQTRSFDDLVQILSGAGWQNFVTGTGLGSTVDSSSTSRTVEVTNVFRGPVGTTEAADTIKDRIAASLW